MDIRKKALWVIDVDRRLITLKEFRNIMVLHPSDISKIVGRSTQNISHAMHEMEENGIVESIGEKSTWKKYMLTDNGKKVLEEVEKMMGDDAEDKESEKTKEHSENVVSGPHEPVKQIITVEEASYENFKMGDTIVTMPGDGIGKVVLNEALRVLEAVGFEAEYVHGDIGWEFWVKEGNALPERTIELLGKHKIGLFGAITSKPKDQAAKELSPELQGEGHVYYSPIVGMRQMFDLDLCIRPCRSFDGNPLNFIRSDEESFMEPEIDAVIFRQNTEGLYVGIEWTGPPDDVRKALETHPKMLKFKDVPGEDLAISTRIFTRGACHRIIKEAFDYARKFGYKSVTVCEKANVIRETSGMMREEAEKLHPNYPGIDLWHTNIDAQMMWLTKNPEDHGVIVAGNMFGDIVSDGYAGLVGGLGFACSANIGKRVAVFEPTHGSAPKYEDLDPSIVNPIAMILSSCMMLDHIGETEKADRIREAIAKVISEGEKRTYDMLRFKGGPDVIEKGACTTPEMTDAIIEKLEGGL